MNKVFEIAQNAIHRLGWYVTLTSFSFRLLNYACASQASLPTAEVLLNNEISWLKRVKVSFSEQEMLMIFQAFHACSGAIIIKVAIIIKSCSFSLLIYRKVY